MFVTVEETHQFLVLKGPEQQEFASQAMASSVPVCPGFGPQRCLKQKSLWDPGGTPSFHCPPPLSTFLPSPPSTPHTGFVVTVYHFLPIELPLSLPVMNWISLGSGPALFSELSGYQPGADQC